MAQEGLLTEILISQYFFVSHFPPPQQNCLAVHVPWSEIISASDSMISIGNNGTAGLKGVLIEMFCTLPCIHILQRGVSLIQEIMTLQHVAGIF